MNLSRTYDGVEYQSTKRFDGDEEADAFLEALEDQGKTVKSDRDFVKGILTVFYTAS